jgi:hypothetical protein
MEQLCDAAYATVLMDGIVVFGRGQKPLLLEHGGSGHELLVALLKKQNAAAAGSGSERSSLELGDPREISDELGLQAWQLAIAEFQPTPHFVERATRYVSEVAAMQAASERTLKASLWADSIAYPLTLFAMSVVVVAFGHLLSNKPRLEQNAGDEAVSPQARRVVLKSLLIFGLLSAIDLIWTLLASATGSMREMNPLGNDLLDNPMQLIAFKVVAVSVTIALLYALHRRPIAQVASWWSCLVLTLLTARWLTFHSMFM